MVLALGSSTVLLHKKVPITFLYIHIAIIAIPPIIAMTALFLQNQSIVFGPFQFNTLSWLLALFVLTMGLLVQRYTVRYLRGDRYYRTYFTLLTITIITDALAWLSDDLRIMIACWGVTLLGLTLLIRLKKDWQAARNAANTSGKMFIISMLFLSFSILWLHKVSGEWRLSQLVMSNDFSTVAEWEKAGIYLLLMIGVIIPAAQWPFQRWLLDSVVAPTPISAVMHAGIVNAGGIMLTRFAPLFSGVEGEMILLLPAVISVLLGTGMMLVQVDYKRQLVGSTIAQMGFMLIQCAFHAYLAAILHAILHGLFKATLFLQSGSALQHAKPAKGVARPLSASWMVVGIIAGVLAGTFFWQAAPEQGYQWISSIILGWSIILAWSQLVASGFGRLGRITGLVVVAVTVGMYSLIHHNFSKLLAATVFEGGTQPPLFAVILLLVILFASNALAFWLTRHQSSTLFAVIYLWLVKLSEPQQTVVESHPTYLSQLLSKGGRLR